MDMAFVELAEVEFREVSVWIPASKILSFMVESHPDNQTGRLVIEAERIRNVRQAAITRG